MAREKRLVCFEQKAYCNEPGVFRSVCMRYEIVASFIKEGGRLTNRVEYQALKLDGGGNPTKTSRTFSACRSWWIGATKMQIIRSKTMTEPVKFDKQKPPMGLVPMRALSGVAAVMGHGAEKYGTHNYLTNPAGKAFNKRLIDAALRHLSAIAHRIHAGDASNDCIDPESGLPHICHATASLLMLVEREMEAEEKAKPKGVPYA